MNLEREFSKDHAQDERDKLAKEIKEERKKSRQDWGDWSKEEVKAGSQKVENLHESLRLDFLGRLFSTKSFLEKEEQWKKITREESKERISERQGEFREKLESLVKEIPLTKEEQEKYLSEETLTQMSLEDYILLLRRLSGNFVSHVTRYGVREQTFMSTGGGHTKGEGQFIDGFTPILKDKKLQSFFSNLLSRKEYSLSVVKDSINKYKESYPDASKEKIIELVLGGIIGDSPWHEKRVGDRSGIHFGSGAVLSGYYGAEFNYDIYFYYPAEVIAKNYTHDIPLEHGGSEVKGDWYNDLVIWNADRGVPVDAGICCIPKDILVDKKTGSQYDLNPEGSPNIDDDVKDHLDFYSANEELFKEMKLDLRKKETNPEDFNSAIQEWSERLKFKDIETFKSFYEKVRSVMRDGELEKFYRESGMYYKKPDKNNLTTSQEYWEDYFQKFPEQKPSKIVFYDSNYKFTGSYGSTKGKDEVLKSLEAHTLKKVDEDPGYKPFMESKEEELREIIEKAYEEV